MKQGQNIVLIGFMGSGKTTVGVKLSYRLRMTVEDTDKLIERREGRSISEIFADDGEEYFRELETNLLEELGERSGKRIYNGRRSAYEEEGAESSTGKSRSSVGRSQGSALATDGRVPELPKSYD